MTAMGERHMYVRQTTNSTPMFMYVYIERCEAYSGTAHVCSTIWKGKEGNGKSKGKSSELFPFEILHTCNLLFEINHKKSWSTRTMMENFPERKP
jgi:hypothetical protein